MLRVSRYIRYIVFDLHPTNWFCEDCVAINPNFKRRDEEEMEEKFINNKIKNEEFS